MESSSKNWFIRVGDGINFENSSSQGIWGIPNYCKLIEKDIKKNDKLWFVKNKTPKDKGYGRVIAVAQFIFMRKRNDSTTPTNEELNWTGEILDRINRLIYYTNLIDLAKYNVYSGIRNQSPIISYENNRDTLNIDLITEYKYIMRYLQPSEDI
jgi:hypothetical protein